jgi:alkylhydroperoxidase family enzyme
MTANVFQVFMSKHPPIEALVDHANQVLWDESALHPVVKERLRIAAAEAVGCSYCAAFRTDAEGGGPILAEEDSLSEEERVKAELAERFATAIANDTATDELTVEMQEAFTEAEFTDLVFSIGWFIGTQHIGRLMHWDNACPVAPIRKMVEAGEAA